MTVFLLSAAAILYVIAGYPLLLGLLARWFPRPVRKQPDNSKTVSVLIAVRDGEPWIRNKLESILRLDYPRDKIEIFVISDGSRDRTPAIVEEYASRGVRLICVPPGGKPAALNAALPLARHEILLLTDVRQELDPPSLGRLIACFADPSVGAVSGTLLIRDPETLEEANVGLYWRYETRIRECLSAVDSMLGATGPFYALRRELAVPLPPDILLDDVYLPLAAFFRGYRLIVESSALAFDFPTTLETEFRRKVRTLAGNYQILRFYPALLGPGNRMWVHFVSYKLGRLLLPYLLIALAVSSFWLPGWLAAAAIAGQVAFYSLALLDKSIPDRLHSLKRITSPARTFVTLMLAAICAVAIFFVPARSLWSKPTRTRGA